MVSADCTVNFLLIFKEVFNSYESAVNCIISPFSAFSMAAIKASELSTAWVVGSISVGFGSNQSGPYWDKSMKSGFFEFAATTAPIELVAVREFPNKS